MFKYNHKEIEHKWREKWDENDIYKAEDFSEKPKKYILAEFPYPSGKALHAGHMMRYTVPDIYSRFLRMTGYNVLFPMGWDAFGLPAENFAIKTGIHPEITTKEAISNYKDSIKKMGYGIDWSREINSTDPTYYKWTQWLFLKFFENGLAEYREMPIWWCEALKTVLSDEEVLTDKDGNKISERGEHPVEKKMLKQWVLKITEYADKLLEGLDEIDFPESIKSAQANWIGKSEGALVKFSVGNQILETFTTRPDTIFGVTYLAIAPESPVLEALLQKAENSEEVQKYIEKASSRSDLERQKSKEKTGILVKGIHAKHPFTEAEIPIYVADYVLMDYGTGVVMGVPAHDERDNEFAKKHKIDIIEVVKAPEDFEGVFTGIGEMINSGEYNSMLSCEFKNTVIERLEKEGKGHKDTTYKMRDWIFSRQRYWGEPIPLIHKEDGTIEAICKTEIAEEVEKNLPLKLPEVADYNPNSDGTSPLENNKEWVQTVDSEGNPAKRETNTMPNWAGSSWYFLRYIDPNNDKEFANIEKLKYWLPVDKYFGGSEHTTMHLLYSRFWHKFFYDLGLVPTSEPYMWRMNGGILLGPDGTKMSKSKGNVISPMDVIENYGADALRTYICFLGPYEATYPWDDNGVRATWRLLKNIYEISERVSDEAKDETVTKAFHKMLKNITGMIEDLKMNTAISEIMIFINVVKGQKEINRELWLQFIKVLAPFAPFAAEDLWQKLNGFEDWKDENSVHLQNWPEFDEKLLREDKVVLPVQINGKIRDEIEVSVDANENEVKDLALAKENVQKYVEGKEIKNFLYVPKKIVSIVV